jgi:acyl carrier protein
VGGNELTPASRVAGVISSLVGALAPDASLPAEPDQRLVLDLGFDSMRMVELSFILEELFSLTSDAMDDMPVGTVGDLVAYTTKLLDAGRATVPTDHAVSSVMDRIRTSAV